MLIVPFWYLFHTLLVPKVALGAGSSSDKPYNSVFSGITGQVGAMLVKLTEKAKTRHSAAAGYFSQLHRYGPTF